MIVLKVPLCYWLWLCSPSVIREFAIDDEAAPVREPARHHPGAQVDRAVDTDILITPGAAPGNDI
jgi:hypothetical protein